MKPLAKKIYMKIKKISYITNNTTKISQIIKKQNNIHIRPKEIREILLEDYELEYRKMQYGLEMSYIKE